MKESRIGFCTVIAVLVIFICAALVIQHKDDAKASEEDQIEMSNNMEHTYLYHGTEAIEAELESGEYLEYE